MDGCGAFLVSLYTGKGDEYECSNSKGISLLSVFSNLYGRVLTKRVRDGTECVIGDELTVWQCMVRVFAVRQVCEKYLYSSEK